MLEFDSFVFGDLGYSGLAALASPPDHANPDERYKCNPAANYQAEQAKSFLLWRPHWQWYFRLCIVVRIGPTRRGSSCIVARSSACIFARSSACIFACSSSCIVARSSACIVACSSSCIVARRSSCIVARSSSCIITCSSSCIVARSSFCIFTLSSSCTVPTSARCCRSCIGIARLLA